MSYPPHAPYTELESGGILRDGARLSLRPLGGFTVVFEHGWKTGDLTAPSVGMESWQPPAYRATPGRWGGGSVFTPEQVAALRDFLIEFSDLGGASL